MKIVYETFKFYFGLWASKVYLELDISNVSKQVNEHVQMHNDNEQ